MSGKQDALAAEAERIRARAQASRAERPGAAWQFVNPATRASTKVSRSDLSGAVKLLRLGWVSDDPACTLENLFPRGPRPVVAAPAEATPAPAPATPTAPPVAREAEAPRARAGKLLSNEELIDAAVETLLALPDGRIQKHMLTVKAYVVRLRAGELPVRLRRRRHDGRPTFEGPGF